MKISDRNQDWWLESVILACAKLRQEDYCEFEASMDNIVNYSPAWVTVTVTDSV